MRKSRIISLALVFTIAICFAASQRLYCQTKEVAKLRGFVRDEKGRPLALVNVFLSDGFEGDVSDSTGYYEITTKQAGTRPLVAMLIGYEKYEEDVELSPGQTLEWDITLVSEILEMPAATVTASAFTSGDGKGVTLRSMDVITTPGAGADVFLAIKTYPGVSSVDEGSGLFVRGGDVSETMILLDGATVVHPYRWETPTGGVFGTIPPFLLKGTFFSSGGFSAKYGNALSAVLAMESLDSPLQRSYNFNLGLAGISAGTTQPLGEGWGLRFSGNYMVTDLMFKLNGSFDRFTRLPGSADGNLSLTYDYSPTGRLKFFSYSARNVIGVRVDQPSFEGVFDSDEVNQVHNLVLSDIIGENWLIKVSLSLNSYSSDYSFGVLTLDQTDITYKLRVDSEYKATKRLDVHVGTETDLTKSNFRGKVPENEYVLDPSSDFKAIDADFGAHHVGAYVQTQMMLTRKLTGVSGIRADYHNLSDNVVLDPRLSLQYSLTENMMARASWGIYHQFAAPFLYAPGYGNPDLGPMRSVHYITGLEYQKDYYHARLEAYYKDYEHLVIEDEQLGFINRGYGYAQGVDVFFKYGELFKHKINGWVSYSYLRSRRLQPRDLVDEMIAEVGPSPYDITHNFTLVLKYNLTPQFNVGTTLRYATGRPITPIVGAVKDPEFDFYEPIEGPIGSERLPNFVRLDTFMSYYYPLAGQSYVVAYLGISNLADRKNVLDYDYSRDYSERRPRLSDYARFIYVGASLSIAP